MKNVMLKAASLLVGAFWTQCSAADFHPRVGVYYDSRGMPTTSLTLSASIDNSMGCMTIFI